MDKPLGVYQPSFRVSSCTFLSCLMRSSPTMVYIMACFYQNMIYTLAWSTRLWSHPYRDLHPGMVCTLTGSTHTVVNTLSWSALSCGLPLLWSATYCGLLPAMIYPVALLPCHVLHPIGSATCGGLTRLWSDPDLVYSLSWSTPWSDLPLPES